MHAGLPLRQQASPRGEKIITVISECYYLSVLGSISSSSVWGIGLSLPCAVCPLRHLDCTQKSKTIMDTAQSRVFLWWKNQPHVDVQVMLLVEHSHLKVKKSVENDLCFCFTVVHHSVILLLHACSHAGPQRWLWRSVRLMQKLAMRVARGRSQVFMKSHDSHVVQWTTSS